MATGNIGITASMSDEDFMRKLTAQEREIDKLRRQVQGLNQEGKHGSNIFQKMFDPQQVVQYAGSLLSIHAVISQITSAIELSKKHMQEFSDAARKTNEESMAFSALQAGGTKALRLHEVVNIAAGYGIAERGQAWNAVQSLQSAYGANYPNLTEEEAYQKGLNAARTVFAAAKVGIPVERGLELEILGASQGAAPADFLNKAFVAGQMSARTPSTIAGAASGMAFYDDKTFGFAAAGTVAASVPEEQLPAYFRGAGIGLSDMSGGARWFRSHGLAGASQYERAKALAAGGYTTPEELGKIGITEITESMGLAAVARNIPMVEAIMKGLAERAVPGVFEKARAGVVAEIPEARFADIQSKITAEMQKRKALGPIAVEAQQKMTEKMITALAFRRMGIEDAVGFEVVSDAEGGGAATTGKFGRWIGEAFGTPTTPVRPEVLQAARELSPGLDLEHRLVKDSAAWRLKAEEKVIRDALNIPTTEQAEALRKAAESTEQAAENLMEAAKNLGEQGPRGPEDR